MNQHHKTISGKHSVKSQMHTHTLKFSLSLSLYSSNSHSFCFTTFLPLSFLLLASWVTLSMLLHRGVSVGLRMFSFSAEDLTLDLILLGKRPEDGLSRKYLHLFLSLWLTDGSTSCYLYDVTLFPSVVDWPTCWSRTLSQCLSVCQNISEP